MVNGANAVQKQLLVYILQNRCQACYFIEKRLQHRCFFMTFTKFLRTSFLQNNSTLEAASGSKQCKPMKAYTERLYAAEKEMIYLNGSSQVSASTFSKHCWQCPILVKLQGKARRSRPEVFCKNSVLENFANHKTFKNTFFHRMPPLAASEKLKGELVIRRCSVKKDFLRNFSKFSGKHLCQSLFFTALGL